MSQQKEKEKMEYNDGGINLPLIYNTIPLTCNSHNTTNKIIHPSSNCGELDSSYLQFDQRAMQRNQITRRGQ